MQKSKQMLNLPRVLHTLPLHGKLSRAGPLVFSLRLQPKEGTVPGTWDTSKLCLINCEWNDLELTLQCCCSKWGPQTSSVGLSQSCQVGTCMLIRIPRWPMCALKFPQTYRQLQFANIQSGVVLHREHHLRFVILAAFQASFSGYLTHRVLYRCTQRCSERQQWQVQLVQPHRVREGNDPRLHGGVLVPRLLNITAWQPATGLQHLLTYEYVNNPLGFSCFWEPGEG